MTIINYRKPSHFDSFEHQYTVSRRFNIPKYKLLKYRSSYNCNPYIPNIDALNSDIHTLRIQYEYTQKQCDGVAIEGINILLWLLT